MGVEDAEYLRQLFLTDLEDRKAASMFAAPQGTRRMKIKGLRTVKKPPAKTRTSGTATFAHEYKYETVEEWAAAAPRHCVNPDGPAAWMGPGGKPNDLWAWRISAKQWLREPVPAPAMVDHDGPRTMFGLKEPWSVRGRLQDEPPAWALFEDEETQGDTPERKPTAAPWEALNYETEWPARCPFPFCATARLQDWASMGTHMAKKHGKYATDLKGSILHDEMVKAWAANRRKRDGMEEAAPAHEAARADDDDDDDDGDDDAIRQGLCEIRMLLASSYTLDGNTIFIMRSWVRGWTNKFGYYPSCDAGSGSELQRSSSGRTAAISSFDQTAATQHTCQRGISR